MSRLTLLASHCWEDATWAVFIRIKFGKLLRDGKGKKKREREIIQCPLPRAETGLAISLEGVSESRDTGRLGG